MTITPVSHNRALSRFEIALEGQTAVLEYSDKDGILTLNHTHVPPALRKRGLARLLTQFAIETARLEHKKIDPQCSYASEFLQQHPEYADVRSS